MEKLIITIAPNGSVPTKEDTPYVPVTPEEVIQDVYDCYNAGASIVHIHARDVKTQKPVHDYDYFKRVMEGVKSKCNIITQISTGGRASIKAESRARALDLKPEMASLTTGSVNFPNSAYVNEPKLIEYLAEVMKNFHIKPEIEVFDVSMINNALDLVKKGLVEEPLHFNLVMGLKGAIPFSLKNFLHLAESLPGKSTWTVSGIGKNQLPLATLSIVNGGHVRVGLEDNIYYKKGVLGTNPQMVERIVRLAKELGREVATPDEARKILNL